MKLNASPEAHVQFAEFCQLSWRTLNHTTVTLEPVIALDAMADDAVQMPWAIAQYEVNAIQGEFIIQARAPTFK